MKISVIIPMYNAERSIERCITSVINQTYIGDIEVIIVNDGSLDNSDKIVNSLINGTYRDGILFTYINQKNYGVSKARNEGLRTSSGNYIALLDSDDEWLPDKLERQMYHFKIDPSLDFIGCNRNNERLGFPYKENNGLIAISLMKLLFKTAPQTSTAVFRKNILLEVGFFDEEQKFVEDANFWMRISLKKKMVIIPETYVITGGGKPSYGSSGLSSNLKEMEEGVQKNIKEMYQLGNINFYEFCFFKILSTLKYYRRILVVILRKFN